MMDKVRLFRPLIKTTLLTDEFDFDAFQKHYNNSAVPLFLISESGDVSERPPGSDSPPGGASLEPCWATVSRSAAMPSCIPG